MTANLPEPVKEALRRVRRDVEGGPEVNLVSLAIVENHIAALTQKAEAHKAAEREAFQKYVDANEARIDAEAKAEELAHDVAEYQANLTAESNARIAAEGRLAALAGAAPVAEVGRDLLGNPAIVSVYWDRLKHGDRLFTHAPAKAREDWQPIATAPKDRAVLVTFDPRDISINAMTPGVMLAYWDAYYAPGGRGYDGECDGWVDATSGEGCHLHYGYPTHWQPLPALATFAEGKSHE